MERKKLYNVKDLAAFLDVSEKTIYNMLGRGQLPYLKIGGQYRFDPEDVKETLRGPAERVSPLAALREVDNQLEKRLLFLALLTKELEDKGVRPVLVGGNAVEFYTAGGYATADIDVVAPIGPLNNILSIWGFKKEGRFWYDESLGIAVEAPDSVLAGDTNRLTAVEIGGLTCYIIGIEDIIIDRLNAAVHWKSQDDRYWSKSLLQTHRGEIDWAYLRERSRDEKTDELLGDLERELDKDAQG